MRNGFGGIYVTPMQDRKEKTMSKEVVEVSTRVIKPI